MIKRIGKILLGLLFLPFCLGFTWQFGSAVFTINYKPVVPYYFFAGGLAYLTVHLLFKKPIFTYVMGHELTHALFAILFGGSVKSLQASDRGGRVIVTKSNFFITLAPYFFPLYTFLALLLYGAARAADAGTAATNVLVFVSGSTFAFHLILTFMFLQADQTDVQEQGAFFSYPLIYLFNVAFAAFLVDVYLADNMSYLKFFTDGIMKGAQIIALVFTKISLVAQRI